MKATKSTPAEPSHVDEDEVMTERGCEIKERPKGRGVDKADPYPTLPRRSLMRDRRPGEA